MCRAEGSGSKHVFKAHRLLYHSTLGSKGIKKKKRSSNDDLLRPVIETSLEGVPREQKMLKGHLPRVIYHQVY